MVAKKGELFIIQFREILRSKRKVEFEEETKQGVKEKKEEKKISEDMTQCKGYPQKIQKRKASTRCWPLHPIHISASFYNGTDR